MAGQPGDDDRGDDDRSDSDHENEIQNGSVMIMMMMMMMTIMMIMKYLPTARVTCGQLLPPIGINFSHLKSQVEFISVKISFE